MTAADPLLILGILLLIIIVFIINLYILAYWQHPDDKNESYWPRVVIVLGLQLSATSVLMIPIDVANNGGNAECDSGAASYCGGIDMSMFWKVLFCFIAFFLVLPIPLATFYYEADDGSLLGELPKSKWLAAVKSEAALLVVVLLILLNTYFTSAFTTIPLVQYSTSISKMATKSYTKQWQGANPLTFIDMTVSDAELALIPTLITVSDQNMTLTVDFVVYLVALAGWVMLP